MKRIALLALAVAGCATPYQPIGMEGGFEDFDMGNGRHQVVVQGNEATGPVTLTGYLHRRAREICGGSYNLGEPSTVFSRGVHTVSAVVECEAQRVAQP